MSTERSAIEGMAGRELDARVATEVFGWTDVRVGSVGKHPSSGRYVPVPAYSEDIAAAWLVVEKLEAHPRFVLAQLTRKSSWRDNAGHMIWEVEFRECEMPWRAFTAEADTAPLAICLAALSTLAPDSVPTPSEEGTP